jgi:transketolase
MVRPADPNETALAWRFAIGSTDHPTAMAFSRQGVPTLPPDAVPLDAVERGAYVLRDPDGDPDVILIGTGTEVHIAVEAADALESEGVAARVVSMPCWERFDEQDDAYRDSVLPPEVRARVAVEAASPFGWDHWIGQDGEFVGMHGFGASGPADKLYEHFGITADAVAERARTALARTASAGRA